MYHSTRGKEQVKASDAIVKGLANDGGLYITQIPKVEIKDFLGKSYQEMALMVFRQLLDDFKEDDLKEVIHSAYQSGFDTKELVTLKKVDSVHFLELYHGPTLAFKDMALTVLPHLMMKAKQMNGLEEETIILTATSGDTGAAALNGFKDVKNTRIIVFYPDNGVSEVQKRQMLSFNGTNCKVIALKGNFDDCQSFVKKVFSDTKIRVALKEKGKALSSANSINIGRLIPQIVYYFYSYIQMVQRNEICLGERVNYVVPTGNFGNILACHYAKEMGLPVDKMICASNKNKILTDFLTTGIYDIKRDFYKTNSPSMDILISSNLERLLYEGANKDTLEVKALMEALKNQKEYQFSFQHDDLEAGYASEEETLASIKEVFDQYGYLMDTHTAVAYHVYKEYLKKKQDLTKTIIVSTACPYKFSQSVCDSLGVKGDTDFSRIQILAQMSDIPVHPSLNKIKDLNPKTKSLSIEEANQTILDLLLGDFHD